MQDLPVNLFKRCLMASDKQLMVHIQSKKEEQEEGKQTDLDMLMTLADNKCKTLKAEGTWNAPSPEEDKILALGVQVSKLKKQAKKGRHQTPQNLKDRKGGSVPKTLGKRELFPDWFTHRCA